MNLSSTSWIHQPDNSFVVKDLQYRFNDRRYHSTPLLSAPHAIGSTTTASAASTLLGPNERRLATLHATTKFEAAVEGKAQLLRGRTRKSVLVDLQRIRGEANAFVLQRLLLRWGLYAVRQGALRKLQQDTYRVLWQRVGGRCFAWWRLITERRLCREALYQEAVLREAAFLRDSISRVAWVKWQRWARVRARRRDRATRLSLINRQRHALLRFNAWCGFPRRCAVLRRLQSIRFTAERWLARFVLVRWRLHALENFLLFPLEVKVAHQTALTSFRAWKRRALIGVHLRRLQQEASWQLGVCFFQKWKRWLRRRLQAALLQKMNETRQMLHTFTQWAWQHQLNALSQQ